MPEVRLSRRGALTGAAWTAPVVVVASAVPALAASPSSSLDLRRGGSAAELTTDGTSSFYDLHLVGLSVVVPSALGAGQLSLVCTFTPASSGGPAALFVLDEPAGWTSAPAPGATGASVSIVYGSAVTGGTEVQVPSGFFVGASGQASTQSGTFVLTATAPGLTADTETFATGPVVPRGTSGRRVGQRVRSSS